MTKRRVTSKMVAERAGVSQTTVSFVLNNVQEANISEETAARVLRAAEELGYVRDSAARMLARGVSDNIGLVLTQPHEQVLLDVYVASLLTGIMQIMRPAGLRVIVELTDGINVKETSNSLVRGRAAAGLIIAAYHPSPEDVRTMRALAQDGYPIVSLTNLDPLVPSVTAAGLSGVHQVMTHLIEMGHKRIGAISYAPEDHAFGARKRLQTYVDVLQENGLHFDPSLIAYANYNAASGYAAAEKLLDLSQPPTAIFGLNDVVAFGAMAAIEERGLRIPQDVAVVGFDDIQLARYATPALTSVHGSDIERGRIAAEILLSLVRGQVPEALHVELPTRLIVRDSSNYPAHGA
ncbi:LacI family DNA-binding transcriptional regulator [Phototrophicus methaneseepsis]|uniref:LacI family DNA-binding transcriptional regulator n=1 Tax=Phototrophicus methaneseepsis TaxID=2710758 RepID=A0A7S8IG09_9CHLR|nr:LacI family DNA-binding transcriptional regulator [Phototrophicus methaneseepsis]QPC84181.1 LacI family DNA-binding transcriptional regulator [Phototrophicus methaneseepsis]